MDARAQGRRKIEVELRDAIQHDVLRPHYQPLIDLSSGRITGFEALARWPHPDRGMISPFQRAIRTSPHQDHEWQSHKVRNHHQQSNRCI